MVVNSQRNRAQYPIRKKGYKETALADVRGKKKKNKYERSEVEGLGVSKRYKSRKSPEGSARCEVDTLGESAKKTETESCSKVYPSRKREAKRGNGSF